jgi:hypothetical protein
MIKFKANFWLIEGSNGSKIITIFKAEAFISNKLDNTLF